MYAPTLRGLRYDAEERARKGLGWMVARVDDLRPAAAMTRWTHADRARMAAAEYAVSCQSLARLVPLADRVFVVLLADWMERLAVPELIAWGRAGAPAWYRPLVLTAGALADCGVRVPELDTAVRAYGPPAANPGAFGRSEHAIEAAYWWGKMRRTTDATAVDVACEREIRRLRREPLNEWTARAVNLLVLCQSDYGKTPDEVSPYAIELLRRTTAFAVADGHAAVAADCAFARWCLGLEWDAELVPVIQCVSRAQRASGAFVPHLRRGAAGVDETERGAQATLAGVLGSLALAHMLREHLDQDASSDEANTVNAAQ